MQDAIAKIDPSFEQSTPYLLALCAYLSKRQAYKLLIELQVFMKDHVRAGLTCIRQFSLVRDTVLQLSYLEAAKVRADAAVVSPLVRSLIQRWRTMYQSNFQESFNVPQNPYVGAVLQTSDVSRKMQSVQLQIEVTRFFYSEMKTGIPESLASINIFGTADEQTTIAEQVLVLGNFELAFKLIQSLRLNGSQVYPAATQRLARRSKRNPNAVFELLKLFKVRLAHSAGLLVMVVLLQHRTHTRSVGVGIGDRHRMGPDRLYVHRRVCRRAPGHGNGREVHREAAGPAQPRHGPHQVRQAQEGLHCCRQARPHRSRTRSQERCRCPGAHAEDRQPNVRQVLVEARHRGYGQYDVVLVVLERYATETIRVAPICNSVTVTTAITTFHVHCVDIDINLISPILINQSIKLVIWLLIKLVIWLLITRDRSNRVSGVESE